MFSHPYASPQETKHTHSNQIAGAIVVGGDYQGLGIVRSLGRRGIPVCVIDDEHSIARYSRYTKRHLRVPDLRDESRTVEQIITSGRSLGMSGWLLFPTREETVAAFSRHRDELTQYFRVPTPEWNSVKWVWDKRCTYQLASTLGIPTPRTWYVNSATELVDLELTFPVAIKPAIKEHFIYATKAKAWRANDRKELSALYRNAAAHIPQAEIIVQEIIPGDGQCQFAYCAFFKNRRSIGRLTARRVRQHPPEFGRASTYVETIEMPELQALSERFLAAIDYYGLVEMEYKLDPRDGHLKLLDVNARTWGYHSIGFTAGVDFPYLLYADQMHGSVDSCSGRPGVRWIRLITDFPTALLELRRGNLKWKTYLSSVWSADTEAVFSRRDPLPGLVELSLVPYLIMKRGF